MDQVNYTLGQRMADVVAKFGGSWAFVFSFIAVMVIWILINSIVLLLETPFDPYPFILLNLVLSCLAALQAPIIMMSQNRQAEKDRIMEKKDYKVNKKAKQDIEEIQKKLDYLIAVIEDQMALKVEEETEKA